MNFLIFGGDNYNTLGMIRTLGEEGIPVYAVIYSGDYVIASKSKYIKKLRKVSSIEEGYEFVKKYGEKNGKEDKIYLLVEGDATTEFLDEHYDQLRNYYIYNQAQGNLVHYMNKHEQVKIAAKHGLNTMKTWTVDVGVIPEDIIYPVTTKAVSSKNFHWKSEVFVCKSEKELKDAYSRISSPQIILQQFLEKNNELCLDGFSINRGNVQFITIASNYRYLIPGKYSFACNVFNFHDEKMINTIREIMSEIGFEGIYSIEFLVDTHGELYFLEINFRNSGWSYASTVAGMPLPILWAKAMDSKAIDQSWKKEIKEGFIFIDDFNDFKARVMSRKMSLLSWIKEYKNADCRLSLGRKDSYPMFAYLFHRAIRKFKKGFRN